MRQSMMVDKQPDRTVIKLPGLWDIIAINGSLAHFQDSISWANNNILEGQIYCDDGKMTYAVVGSG